MKEALQTDTFETENFNYRLQRQDNGSGGVSWSITQRTNTNCVTIYDGDNDETVVELWRRAKEGEWINKHALPDPKVVYRWKISTGELIMTSEWREACEFFTLHRDDFEIGRFEVCSAYNSTEVQKRVAEIVEKDLNLAGSHYAADKRFGAF